MNFGQSRRSRAMQASSSTVHYLYRCYDKAGLLVYIGCSADPTRRLDQHRRSTSKTSRLIQKHVTRVEIDADAHRGRDAGHAAEAQAIHAEQPLFNVQHRCIPAQFAVQQIADYEAGKPVRSWPEQIFPSARVLASASEAS